MVDIRLVKKNLITPKLAFSHATAHLHIGIYTKTPGMTDWIAYNLENPTTVYDLNDQPLFYDFPVVSTERQVLGLVRASASRVLGVPIPSVYVGGIAWDIRKASASISELLQKKWKGKVVDTKLVCYAYPKLGLAVEWQAQGKESVQRTIFDVSDLSIVPEKAQPEMRGPGAWSFYQNIPDSVSAEAVKYFTLHDKMISELQERSRKDLTTKLTVQDFKAVQSGLATIISAKFSKILTFCTHRYSHECFTLHGQENSVWCTVATGQMILDFWRYYYSQSDIANAMGTGSSGTSWSGEENGLESLTSNRFDAQSDFSPNFDKGKTEINDNRPFDYSYSYHSMACVGFRRQTILIIGTQPMNSVYLYDPWPVNIGTIRWETWGAGISPVAGFVYLRRL